MSSDDTSDDDTNDDDSHHDRHDNGISTYLETGQLNYNNLPIPFDAYMSRSDADPLTYLGHIMIYLHKHHNIELGDEYFTTVLDSYIEYSKSNRQLNELFQDNIGKYITLLNYDVGDFIIDYIITHGLLRNYFNDIHNDIEDQLVDNLGTSTSGMSSNNVSISDVQRLQQQIIDSYPPDKREFYNRLVVMANFLSYPPSFSYNNGYDVDEKYIPSLRDFTWKYDRLINKSLRQNLIDSRTLQMVNDIISAIKLAPDIDTNIVLYRGTSSYFKPKIGMIQSNDGFMSKTSDITIASHFTDNSCCLFMFTTKLKYLALMNFSNSPIELEYLTYPGEKYEIVTYHYIYDLDHVIRKVYHCVNLPNSQINPRINAALDRKLDQYEQLLPSILSKVVGKTFFIISGIFTQCIVGQSGIYPKFFDSLSRQQQVMKYIQLTLGMNLPYEFIILDTNVLKSNTTYTVIYNEVDDNSDGTTKRNLITNQHANITDCIKAISNDIHAQIYDSTGKQLSMVKTDSSNMYSTYQLM